MRDAARPVGRRLGTAGLAVALVPALAPGFTTAPVGAVSYAAADRASGQVLRDVRGDAHPSLDVTRVRVRATSGWLRVRVHLRDVVAPFATTSGVASQVGVHLDTGGDRRPEHLVRLDGFHAAAGSTRDWNRLRPNGVDPWGDWTDCVPSVDEGTALITVLSHSDTIVLSAPLSCLGAVDRVRVAVQSYATSGRPRADWLGGVRSYSRWVDLG